MAHRASGGFTVVHQNMLADCVFVACGVVTRDLKLVCLSASLAELAEFGSLKPKEWVAPPTFAEAIMLPHRLFPPIAPKST